MANIDLTLGQFKSTVGRGTRPNRYTVDMQMPSVVRDYVMSAEVSAASLPDATIPAIQVPFRGRILKLPGDRRYAPWTFTVYDTEDGTLWNRLHEWSNEINNHESNITEYGFNSHTTSWTIKHYDLNGDDLLKSVTLFGCWPTIVGPFQLQYGAMDTLSQFTCTVEYEYFEVNTL